LERIQRALEIARTQRGAVAAQAAAAAKEPSAATPEPAPALHAVAEPPSRTAPTAHAQLVSLDRRQLRERRVVFADDADSAAHAYRMLRTQLLRQMRADGARMIGVISAIDGEGKTLTAVNLALSVAAEPNQTVLLIDLDLRRPDTAALLGLRLERGLERWFDGSVSDIGELFVRFEGIERLRVVPTLHAVSGSSERLAAGRARELLAEIRNRYSDRLTIVDLPPVLLADDVLTVAPLLDGVLLVVAEGRTKREDVARLRELLHGVRILGVILNVSSESEQRAY
jgi:protein-tyrosine kinase